MNRRLLLVSICLAIIGFSCTGSEHRFQVGIVDRSLENCPSSPNCVSTQSKDPEKAMAALPFTTDLETTRNKILSIIRKLPRTKIVSDQPDYLHVEFQSLVFRFIDDVEFLFDDRAKVVNFRSASRVGYSDFGVNRNRMEKISNLYFNRKE